jgi:hypothetical protein
MLFVFTFLVLPPLSTLSISCSHLSLSHPPTHHLCLPRTLSLSHSLTLCLSHPISLCPINVHAHNHVLALARACACDRCTWITRR